MTSTPTASAVNTDLADRLLTQAFVIIDVTLNVGPGSRQLTWDALEISGQQRETLINAMGAKPPTVTPFPELTKAGVQVKSSIEKLQRRWLVKSEPFWLYPQTHEEGVATDLLAIKDDADTKRAAMIALAPDARARWHQQVIELLSGTGVSQDDEIAVRMRALFPSDQRIASCLGVFWSLRTIASLEDQATRSVQLQEALLERDVLSQEEHEFNARQQMHREAERMVRQSLRNAADCAASEAMRHLTKLVGDLQQGAIDKPMNGQRRARITNLTKRFETLSQCFEGSGGLLDVADRIREFTGGVAKTHKQGSDAFRTALTALTSDLNSEIQSLKDPTKQGHRSIAQFIQ